jgi:hypothetical protein
LYLEYNFFLHGIPKLLGFSESGLYSNKANIT